MPLVPQNIMNTVSLEVAPEKELVSPQLKPESGRAMTPFVAMPHDVRENQIYRETLLAQPPEFFKGYCQGRIPDIFERMILVERLVQAAAAPQVFVNNLYRVQVRPEGAFIHLSVTRLDGQPSKDWYHFQQIKNEIVGPQYEAVELFPSESRLVDMDNEYHIWVNADPNFRFPFGYARRHVVGKPLIYGGKGRQEEGGSPAAAMPADSLAGMLS
jgi:hypothetical protein